MLKFIDVFTKYQEDVGYWHEYDYYPSSDGFGMKKPKIFN